MTSHPCQRRHRSPARVIALILLVLSVTIGGVGRLGADEPARMVFAAASLTEALEELGRKWHAQAGDQVQFSFAASSVLARQIEAGAPAELFASADTRWMDYLAERGLIAADSRVSVIGNRLVLIVPSASPVTAVPLTPGFSLADLLGDGRLATGDPAHVPVGRYAEEALTALGVWTVAEPRLARTDNVRAALALVERGEVPIGIVYATDALQAKGVRVVATFPSATHTPITYPMAVVRAADGPRARALLAFLTGAEGRAVFARFGFTSD